MQNQTETNCLDYAVQALKARGSSQDTRVGFRVINGARATP